MNANITNFRFINYNCADMRKSKGKATAMAKKKGKPRGNGKAALILAATQVPPQPPRLPERVEECHDDDDYIPDGDMIEEMDTNEEINDEEMNGAVQNHEDTMNEDQMNDELGIDPRQSNGREPTLKAPADANEKVIVRCTRGMYENITFFYH
ncbi:uncharacterized protein LOC120108545 [Phoenix dactylifera]|uniref:Uncharacterized protein LOC120108545 n=1 Tax=Phoenix dactylifera TaxID=42345 RepID=A0A8B8ZUZ0_PHODC|nr:uncharacterized protein LOC120108545 [Phoenix dactylifera]